MSNRHIVIMAGGSGTRFWPASRGKFPKQFLKIGSEQPMLRQTVDRVLADVPPENVWVVTGAHHAEHAQAMLPDLPAPNVLVEPAARNTAPCIAWAAATIQARQPDARVAVLPADHHIGDVPRFRAYLAAAFNAADEHIVLFGIIPDRPETGYGYIQRGPQADTIDPARPIHEVLRFVEKPNAETAQTYLASGDYLWNSGMFVFPAALMLAEIEAYLPELASGIQTCVRDPATVASVYPELPSISIDYGVMERSGRTRVIPSQFAWSDVGSWDSAMEIYPSDAEGNVVLGDATLVDVEGSLVQAEAGRKVAVVGLSDIMVVDTPDALLIVRRGHAQSVKKVVEALKKDGRSDLL